MNKWLFVPGAILIIVVFAGSKYLGFFSQPFSSVVEKPIERIGLSDLKGNVRSFDELISEETIIYFFASWCNPCFKTLDRLQQLSDEKQLNIRLQAIALDEDVEGVKNMLAMTGFRGDVWLAVDGTMALQQRLFGNENRAVPYVVKLDEQTNIKERTYKMNTLDKWRAVLVGGSSLYEASGV